MLLYFFFEERDFFAVVVRLVVVVAASVFWGDDDCAASFRGSVAKAGVGALAKTLPARAASRASARRSPSRWYPAHVRWMRSPPSR